jgi:hypothetical protein
MKPNVKIILYIGLFLLLIGVCLYGYVSYEGFQISSGTEGSFCDVQANKCNATCIDTATEPGGLPKENTEESDLYDIYELNNLQNVPSATNEARKTTVVQYDMAGELAEFDTGAPIPWDYENRQLDPETTVWGAVNSDVSKKLFQKSYTRALFGSANPATFIENDNNTGENQYRSNVFQTTVYGAENALMMQTAEAFQDMYTEVLIENVMETLFETDYMREQNLINAELDKNRPVIARVKNPLSKTGNLIEVRGKSTISPEQARANVKANAAIVQAEQEGKLRKAAIDDLPVGEYKTADGKLTAAGELKIERLKKSRQGAAKVFANNKILSAIESRFHIYTKLANFFDKPPNRKFAPSQLRIVRAFRARMNIIGKALKPVSRSLAYVSGKKVLKAVAGYTGKFLKMIFTMIVKTIMAEAVLASFCKTTVAQMTGQATAVGAATFGIGAAIIGAAAAAFGTSCGLAQTALWAITTSCITWAPQLLTSLVDETNSQCPEDAPWNLMESFYKLPGGEAGWAIFSAIPIVGDISSTIGPYLCWGTPGGVLTGKLKENIKTPYYYYDPTLSMYTEEKPYAKVPDPMEPTSSTLRASGISENKPEYTDYYIYKDYYGNYPFLVDFSHKIMLNKMAQYYYDTSRRNMFINPDGTGTFEYISRIYGVISSSELSCDIQCEISEITIDTLRGTKLCERIVDVQYDSPSTYHDRRFYFYVDISKGASLDTPENRRCAAYLEHVQTPTRQTQYPSCANYGSGSNGYSSAECTSFLGLSTIYDSNNKIKADNIDIMARNCNKRLMMSTFAVNGAVKGINGARETWDAKVRMDDNMEKYFVTGCTFIDGTAPDAVDSKGNVEGIQVGDTVVAVGDIGVNWFPPTFKPPPTEPGDGVFDGTKVPDNIDCKAVHAKFNKYGTTSKVDRTIDQTAIADQTATDTVVVKSTTPSPWETNLQTNGNQTTFASPRRIRETELKDVAKNMMVMWVDCVAGDTECRQKKAGFWENFALGSAMGYIGSTVNTKGIPTGAIAMAGLGYLGVQQLMDCTVSEAAKQEGTFVVNGMVITSHAGSYLIHHGPTIQFSPGYKPTIDTRGNMPSLQLYDCVNRYTVRKFVSAFRSTYANSNRRIQKIYDISPRRDTTRETLPTGHIANSAPCCVFKVQYRDGNNPTPIITDFKLPMNRVSLDMVSTYQPGSQVFQDNIPKAEPFLIGSFDSVLEAAIPSIVATDIRPSSCPTTVSAAVTCNNLALQARLFDQFNETHVGVAIDNGPIRLKPGDPWSVPASNIKNPINAWTLPATDGDNACIFDINFTQIDSRTGNPSIPAKVTRRKIKMNLVEVQSPTDETRCLYDLASDDYPYNVWYQKIPKNWFDVPPAPTDINTNFQPNPPNCPELTDCSGVDLMANLVTQFNQAHTDRKISMIYRYFTPLILRGSTPIPVCDYDVEMTRMGGGTPIVNKETLRMYLKPVNSGSSPQCMYDLDTDDSETASSGISLNESAVLGILDTPFAWSPSFTRTIKRALNNLLLPVLGLDSVNTIKTASVTAKNTATTVYNDAALTQKLYACPQVTCNDPFVLQRILNRYNFDTYPTYPSEQYQSERRSIVSFRRAGIASPTRCHVELIERVDTYDDFLYESKPENSRTFLQQYYYDIEGDNCAFTIKPLSKNDISKRIMDLSGDPYGIQSESSVVDPRLTGRLVLNPLMGSNAGSPPSFTYTSPTINCISPEVLKKIRMIYEARDVSAPSSLIGGVVNNQMVSVLKYFNPAPNVCEYKMNIRHKYFDIDYGYYFNVPPADKGFSTNDESSYIVATWAPNTDYLVETGTLLLNRPEVEEFFFPDLVIKGDKFYRETDKTTPLNLPYLSAEGMVSIDPTQGPRFTEIKPPMPLP